MTTVSSAMNVCPTADYGSASLLAVVARSPDVIERVPVAPFLYKDAAKGSFLLSMFGGQISLDSNFASMGGGAAYYNGAWRNTVTGQGGWSITNSAGVFSIQTGSNPGAAGSVITDMIERFRIDGAGNANIGGVAFASNANVSTAGTQLTLNSGKLLLQHDGASAYLRPTNAGSHLYLGSSNNNFWAVYTNGQLAPVSDNTLDAGSASFRIKVVYAATGAINTSDERDKLWRGDFNAQELMAARRIANEIGVYQWLDAVAEKGEAARLHIGVRAQRVFAILRECGLDWHAYAWCCYDQWEEQREPIFEPRTVKVEREVNIIEPIGETEDGQPIYADAKRTLSFEEEQQFDTGVTRIARAAGDRYGVRPDQLVMFLIAAQEQRLKVLESMLASGK